MDIICFDLDNTLVKGSNAHILAFEKAFVLHHLPKKTKKGIVKYLSLESTVLVKKLYPSLNQNEIRNVVLDHDKILMQETGKKITAIPGALKALHRLKPHYKLALISNCKHKEILATLAYAKLDTSLFEIIIGNDEVKLPKPAPDEIIKAEQLLHIKKGYMIGDATYDIRAGKKAKLKTIAVLTGHHTIEQLSKENPDAIVKSIADVPKILLKEHYALSSKVH